MMSLTAHAGSPGPLHSGDDRDDRNQGLCLCQPDVGLLRGEMDALAKAADYRKVHLLLIEPLVSARPQLSWERRYVVDKDLCELYPEEDNRAY